MIKKTFSCISYITISIFLILSSSISNVQAQDIISQKTSSPITVSINDINISSDTNKPYQDSNSIVMVPLNSIYKNLGNDFNLKMNKDYVLLSNSSYNITLKNNYKKISSNGKTITLSTAPVIKNNVIYVPLEFFSKVLGKTINWNSYTKVAKICTPYKNEESYFKDSLNSNTYSYISQKLNTYMTLLQKYDNFHGSVLVAKGGNILLNKGYSKSDFEQNIDNSPQTEFPIGSMTKQFTAMAIMQLEEKGLLSEDDPISKYIPDYPKGNTITIKNLLTHTSGIVNYTNLPEFWTMKTDSFKDIQNVINLFKNKPLEFEPGTKFSYSNSGYVLLGYIITKVTGTSYIDYLKENIFKPLNMNNTGIAYNGSDKLYTSSGYSGYLDIYPIDDEMTLNGTYGAGSLYSTTEDLYKWDRALYTEKLVSNSTLNKIFTGYVKVGEYQPYYGYGWMITDGKYGKEIYHGGNILGFTSNIARYPENDLTIILLTNVGYYNLNSLNDTLADICMGGSYTLPTPKTEINLDSKILEKYAGTYYLNANQQNITIKNENGNLYYEPTEGIKYQLFPESSKKFFLKEADLEIEFITGSKDSIYGLKFYKDGVSMIAHRK
ncbi:serine hydrolase [Clostridium sp.]|jgi:CubicO group peptidase (beta-lactamase class C family)|uniref:serine hydrolase n=1 Tax=Clostridium sp. TaxID=1506 RepID=UPI003A5C37DB